VTDAVIRNVIASLPDEQWRARAACHGQSALFFSPAGERYEHRTVREAAARLVCERCPVLEPCREQARERREYGFWGGESEEDRAAAGYRVRHPVGRVARYPRAMPVPSPRSSAPRSRSVSRASAR
jgi:WhiB family redox-sensing transcriptional regulator